MSDKSTYVAQALIAIEERKDFALLEAMLAAFNPTLHAGEVMAFLPVGAEAFAEETTPRSA